MINKRFEEFAIKLENFKIDKNGDKLPNQAKKFLDCSVQMAGRISFKKKTDKPLKHLDQTKAYTNYENIESTY